MPHSAIASQLRQLEDIIMFQEAMDRRFDDDQVDMTDDLPDCGVYHGPHGVVSCRYENRSFKVTVR